MSNQPIYFSRKDHDRRSGSDRRQSYSIEYFDNGGIERRDGMHRRERRRFGDRRLAWMMVFSPDGQMVSMRV
jgi:hypothetical protein